MAEDTAKTLRDRLNDSILTVEVSLIRKFDEQTSDVPDILKLTLGEPDFDTPEHIKEAAIRGIKENFTHYTANAGMLPLREGVAAFMKKKVRVVLRSGDGDPDNRRSGRGGGGVNFNRCQSWG